MKITLNHYEKGNLSIPSAALKLAKLNGETAFEGHIGDSNLAVMKKQMSAKELVDGIRFYADLSADLTEQLALACGECDDCGYCCEDDENGCPEDCRRCENPCNGVDIPACVLTEAGIGLDAALECDARDGEIIIRSVEHLWEEDVLETVSQELLEQLSDADICLANLRELLESGEVVYGK